MPSQMPDSALHGALLIAVVVVLAFLTLASKAPFRVIGRIVGPVIRILFRPIMALLRALRILRRAAKAPRNAGPVGASAWSAIAGLFRPETGTERALRGGDEDAEEGPERALEPHDFAEEESRLARRGFIFHWIDVAPNYVPDTSQFTPEIADIYLAEAKKFFSGKVSLYSDEQSLYEDTEGRFIVKMFGARDRRCFYLLNQMRKIINQNIRNLAIIFSIIMSLVFIADVFFGRGIIKAMAGPQADTLQTTIIFSVALSAFGAFLMWLLYFMEYAPNQRNNSREMKNFITRYMSRLNDRYRSAIGNARSVTVGDESDPNKLSSAAQRWHKIVIWMSFRSFFVECFIRNVQFQLRRNSGYYIILIPLLFLVILLAAIEVVGATNKEGVGAVLTGVHPAFWFAFLALLAVYYAFLTASVHMIEEVNQLDWLGFDNLNVDQAMDDVVGKYAEDVGFWKNRVRGGGLG